LSTNAPHGPYLVAQKYKDLYKGKQVPNAAFYGMITNIDENIGRLRRKLDELALTDNTILIFMTDNGTAAGAGKGGFNAGMRGRKGSQYDGGHRVPCFIYWPDGKLTGGRDVGRLTAHIDILPTLIELCGLKRPEVEFDGKSLAPLLEKPGAAWPERTLVVESQRIDHPQKWRRSSVMTDRWRLVDGKELYDITADPGQKKNIAGEHAEVAERLRTHYERWWESVSARHDEYCRIVLGNDAENPATLTCHDWHAARVPWNQSHIRAGLVGNGPWAVEVEQDGTYEIELRRWPREADKPINEGSGPQAVTARLKIGGVEDSKPVAEDAKAVLFQVELKAGPTMLQSWLSNADGKSRGAYYAYVKRVE